MTKLCALLCLAITAFSPEQKKNVDAKWQPVAPANSAFFDAGAVRAVYKFSVPQGMLTLRIVASGYHPFLIGILRDDEIQKASANEIREKLKNADCSSLNPLNETEMTCSFSEHAADFHLVIANANSPTPNKITYVLESKDGRNLQPSNTTKKDSASDIAVDESFVLQKGEPRIYAVHTAKTFKIYVSAKNPVSIRVIPEAISKDSIQNTAQFSSCSKDLILKSEFTCGGSSIPLVVVVADSRDLGKAVDMTENRNDVTIKINEN